MAKAVKQVKNIAQLTREITNSVMTKITEMQKSNKLDLPKNYSYQNALNSAYLILQDLKDKNGKSALEVCSKTSIANALLDMVIQGLSPAKNQCYFVVFGDKLVLMKSYFGTLAVLKRMNVIKNAVAQVIREGDDFDYEVNPETGEIRIIKHKTKLENQSKPIIGAYAVIEDKDGNKHVEIMSYEQIKKAWLMNSWSKLTKAHTEFADQMAKKTVLNRACKLFLNTSSDNDLLIEAFNKEEKINEIEEAPIENQEAEIYDIDEETGEIIEEENQEENQEENDDKVNEDPDF